MDYLWIAYGQDGGQFLAYIEIKHPYFAPIAKVMANTVNCLMVAQTQELLPPHSSPIKEKAS